MLARLLAVAAAAAVLAPPARADKKTGFHERTYTDAKGKKFAYKVYVPQNYNDRKTPVPVILFLHGAGAAKGDKLEPAEVGLGPYIRRHEKTFPFLVVFPQFQDHDRWHAKEPSAARAMAMLDEVVAEYKCDPKRQYLTGYSLGGAGTWALANASPDRWAAIVPVCGPNNAEYAAKIKDIPCWAFHGLDDDIVPPKETREMIAALKKAGGKPEVTYIPKTGHECWDKAYATPELWKWLADQKRG